MRAGSGTARIVTGSGTKIAGLQDVSTDVRRGVMKAIERGAPATAILAALSALSCCLPFGIVGALGLASVSIWLTLLRPWLLGGAVLLLVAGAWQLYRRPRQCSTKRSPVSLALFWVSVVIVLLVIFLPQLVANWMAG